MWRKTIREKKNVFTHNYTYGPKQALLCFLWNDYTALRAGI